MPTNAQIMSVGELYRLLFDTIEDKTIPKMLSEIQDDINTYSPIIVNLSHGKTGIGNEYIRVTTDGSIDHVNVLFPIESLSHWFFCIKSFIQVNC